MTCGHALAQARAVHLYLLSFRQGETQAVLHGDG